MSQDLQVFDELKAEIAHFVQPAMDIRVVDAQSSVPALDTAKQIKSYLGAVEKKRKELVGPLNDRVKLINEYVKGIAAPLTQAETHIRSQLNAFATKQEEIRQAEIRRVEEERRVAAQKLEEERRQAEAALLAKQAQEVAASPETDDLFGAGPDAESVEAKIEREQVELQQAFQEKKAVLEGQAKEAKWDAGQMNIKNARRNWFCEATDLSKVPREFLVITLNEKAVIAMAKAGVTDIPGIRIWSEMAVAIGSKTYAPKELIENG